MKEDPRRGAPKTVPLRQIVEAAREHLVRPVWDLFARRAWCRKQRRELGIRGHSVVWVRGAVVPWAEWGARRGYFEVERMDGLPYLRALGAPIA
jgi:hypothetical protein